MTRKTVPLGMLLALGACKKDDTPPPATGQSKADLLTARPWKIVSQTVTITAGGASLTNNTLDACDKDNFYEFKTDQRFVADEGTTKCSPTDPQQAIGTWAFSNGDQTRLQLTLPTSSLNGEVEIKELTASTLHLYSSQSVNGATYTADAVLAPN